jgi:hypothetical protein
MKKMLLVIGFALMLATAPRLRAQESDSSDVVGCVDSPEDPTIVLALVAGAGALATTWKLNRKREK